MEAHDGRLWATASMPHGATFQFSLPVRPPLSRMDRADAEDAFERWQGTVRKNLEDGEPGATLSSRSGRNSGVAAGTMWRHDISLG